MSIKISTKRQNENSHEQLQQESVKRVRLSSRTTDDNSINTNRIVLRIRKPSEDLSTSRNDTTSNNNNNQLTIEMKDTLEIVKEDDEDQNESQSINVFDIFHQTTNRSEKDEQ